MMDPSQAASAGEKREQVALRPLTRQSRDGQLYVRDPKVNQQISSALEIASDDLIARIQVRDKSAVGYLQEEALVYLMREHWRSKSVRIITAVWEELLRRSQPLIRHQLRALHEDEALQAETDVQTDLLELVLDLNSDRGDFLQVRFWVVLQRMTISAFQRATKYLNSQVLPEDNEGLDAERDEHEKLLTLASQRAMSLEEWALVAQALEAIKEPYRTAFTLYYGEGWQIESNDPAKWTISRYFGKTSRTIRNWIRLAEQALEEWRGMSHE